MKATILLPYDGSPSAVRALEHTLERAKNDRLVVHLLNVEEPVPDYGLVPAYLPESKHREATAERAAALLAPAVERLKQARVAHEAHVEWGDVAATIEETARRLDCDSIVMGTRGLGPVGNLLRRSTATRLVHLTHLPVTLVR